MLSFSISMFLSKLGKGSSSQAVLRWMNCWAAIPRPRVLWNCRTGWRRDVWGLWFGSAGRLIPTPVEVCWLRFSWNKTKLSLLPESSCCVQDGKRIEVKRAKTSGAPRSNALSTSSIWSTTKSWQSGVQWVQWVQWVLWVRWLRHWYDTWKADVHGWYASPSADLSWPQLTSAVRVAWSDPGPSRLRDPARWRRSLEELGNQTASRILEPLEPWEPGGPWESWSS